MNDDIPNYCRHKKQPLKKQTSQNKSRLRFCLMQFQRCRQCTRPIQRNILRSKVKQIELRFPNIKIKKQLLAPFQRIPQVRFISTSHLCLQRVVPPAQIATLQIRLSGRSLMYSRESTKYGVLRNTSINRYSSNDVPSKSSQSRLLPKNDKIMLKI